MKEYIVKSSWHGGYSNGFVCVEIVNEETLNKLRKLIADEFSFWVDGWEGKHSETKIGLDSNDFVVLSDNPDDIAWFRKMFGEYVGNIHYSDYVMERAYDYGYFDEDETEEDD